jgi:hypothetical protein
MAIVKQTNKKTGITYVYESHSYRDKETKQPRSKRKLIGRIDEATGTIVPTRQKSEVVTTGKSVGTNNSKETSAYSSLLESLKEKEETIKSQRAEIDKLRRERQRLSGELEAIVNKLKQ